MGRLTLRAVRRLSVLGVPLIFFFILCYHELFSKTSYILSSASQPVSDAIHRTTQTATESTPTSEQQVPILNSSSPAVHPILENATAYLDAIMDPDDTSFERLTCPHLDSKRYNYLKPTSSKRPSYFFALDLREVIKLLPRLMGSILQVVQFLGPQHCVLSVVEGNSHDGTWEVLSLLRDEIEALGAQYHLQHSDIDPSTSRDRIGDLAALRNLALEPLISNEPGFNPDTTVIFLNDVAICPDDILELVHQRKRIGADMTCGFDWTYVGTHPTFYDVWVARTLAGDSFFEIPPDGNWDSAWNLFWNSPEDQARFQRHTPFQVFSCWNGAAVFAARPLWRKGIRFRASSHEECFQGEPQLFCKDLWRAGYGKIAVIPSVNLEYDNEHAIKIKASKGYTSQWVEKEPIDLPVVEWKHSPPEKVKCMASYENQEWRPWDEGLSEAEPP